MLPLRHEASERERGFTIAELMVTVAIVGILAAIAVPNYHSYRKRAYVAVAVSYMRGWPAAQELYLQKNGHYADADEKLAQQELGVLFVPTDIPYVFEINSTNVQTEQWWGRGRPTAGGLPVLEVDETGVVRSRGG